MKNIQVFKPLIREESVNSVAETLRSGWIGCGPKTQQFESDFKSYLDTDGHCVAVMSATDALEIALSVCGVGPGDEVITTPITFISTNHVILYSGAKPVFADVDPKNGCLDPHSISSKITEKTKAIMVVHLSGASADMDSIQKIADDNGIKIIEDCAHAAGGTYRNGPSYGKKIGNSKNICCFSFQAVKNLPVGDGGMIVLRSDSDAEKAKKLRWLGIDKDTYARSSTSGEYLWKYHVPFVGIKSNVNDILSSIGVEQLKYLDSDNEFRRRIAKFYQKNINNSKITFPDIDIESSSCHFYPIFCEKRDDLMSYMRKNGVYCGMHYQRNDMYSNYESSYLPASEYFANHEITLPIHLHLTDDDIKYIVEVINNF
jgi:perosamine synthetase